MHDPIRTEVGGHTCSLPWTAWTVEDFLVTGPFGALVWSFLLPCLVDEETMMLLPPVFMSVFPISSLKE